MTEQGPEELPETTGPETTEPEDLETVRQALEEEREKSGTYLSNWQRTQADFMNYKRRVEQERQEFSRSANAALIVSILPALDDLERALDSVPEDLADASWIEGIRLIDQKIKGILSAQGLTRIEALGEQFDPNSHEALRQDKGEDGVILAEIEAGYMLNDKILRPSRVVVGNGETE